MLYKVDRIWVFLDAAQPVPAGAYDSQLQERLRHSQLNGASQRFAASLACNVMFVKIRGRVHLHFLQVSGVVATIVTSI